MAANADLVKDLAPELSTESPDRINRFIGFASLSVNTSVWGSKSDLGTGYLAAHMMTMSNRKGRSGVTMEKVGDLARSYAPTDTDDGALGQTSYGQEFLRLRKSLLITPIIV